MIKHRKIEYIPEPEFNPQREEDVSDEVTADVLRRLEESGLLDDTYLPGRQINRGMRKKPNSMQHSHRPAPYDARIRRPVQDLIDSMYAQPPITQSTRSTPQSESTPRPAEQPEQSWRSRVDWTADQHLYSPKVRSSSSFDFSAFAQSLDQQTAQRGQANKLKDAAQKIRSSLTEAQKEGQQARSGLRDAVMLARDTLHDMLTSGHLKSNLLQLHHMSPLTHYEQTGVDALCLFLQSVEGLLKETDAPDNVGRMPLIEFWGTLQAASRRQPVNVDELMTGLQGLEHELGKVGTRLDGGDEDDGEVKEGMSLAGRGLLACLGGALLAISFGAVGSLAPLFAWMAGSAGEELLKQSIFGE